MSYTPFNMRFKSIWRRFVYLIVLTSAIFVIVSWIISSTTEKEKIQQSIQYEMNTVLDEAVVSMVDPLWEYDLNYLKVQVDILLKRPTVYCITIVDKIRGVVVDKGDAELDPTSTIYYGEKAITKNGVNIGTLKVGISSTPFVEKSNEDLRSRIIMILLETSVLAFMILIISYTITKPLNVLEEEIIDFAGGNYSKKITIKSNDEIGRLANTFNQMARKIEEADAELKSLNQSLESKLEERTYELRRTNEYLEEALSQSEEIQSELTVKNEELENAMEQLQYSNKQIIEATKSNLTGQLIAGVAHEIKTPVGVILTTNSYILKEIEEFNDKLNSGGVKRSDLSHFIDTLHEASININRNLNNTISLISNFKEVAVDQTSQRKRQFDLRYYISETVSNLRPVFKHTPYKIDISCPEGIKIDSYPGAYSQILTNLIMNSIKHGFGSRDHGTINIEAAAKDNNIILIYRDNGKGISQENLENIFTPFFSTSHNKGGSGLGLSVVKNLVEQTLQGSISCNSSLGNGVEFTITLPIELEEVEVFFDE